MADQDLPPSLRGGGSSDDLPPSLRANASGASSDLPPSLRQSGKVGMWDAFQVANELAPWNQAPEKGGEAATEVLGKAGMPKTGAAVGTLIQMAPQIALGAQAISDAPAIAQAVTHPIQTIKSVSSAIKEAATAVFSKAPEVTPTVPDLPPSLAATAPSTPGQMELPLKDEALQERLFEPLPKPVQVGVDRIATDLGKKYGGVSSHMPDVIEPTAKIYAEDPKKAEAFLDELLPRLTRDHAHESGFGYVNKLGQEGGAGSMPFPSEDIANQFKVELLQKLQEHPLLQRDIGVQLGLFEPNAASDAGPRKLLSAPQTVQGEGFTMQPPKVQTGESQLPEVFNKKILKDVRSGKIGADVPANAPRSPAQPPYQGETIETGLPTTPFQAPPPSSAATQQDLFNVSRYGGKIDQTPQARLAAAVQDKTLPSPLPDGAADRLAKQAQLIKDGKLTDIPSSAPLTDRLDFNKRVEGTRTGVFYDQYKKGADAANAVDRDSAALYKQFQQKFSIAPNSKESAAMQVYGEAQNKASATQALQDIFGKDKAQKIIDASDWMRSQYDNLWVETNKSLVASGRQTIPYRQDYFTHFKEVGLLDQLGLMGTSTPEAQAQVIQRYQTADKLVQQSRFSKLKDIIFPFMKRQDGEFTTDAVEGFRRYVFASNRIQKLQPYVNELNESSRLLQPNLPGAAKYLQDQANHLSGMADSWDKVITDRLGPKALNIWTSLNRRYMSNLVEANPHVPFMHAMSESLNVAEHSASSTLKAAVGQLMNPEMRAFALENSPTLQARIASTDARTLDAGLVRKSVTSAMTWMDQQIGTHIFLTAFKDAVAKGTPVDEAIKLADNFVGQTQGMISPVNTPPIMRSRVLGNLVPFQNRALAYAKSVFSLWEGKSIPAAALTTVKFGLATAAAAVAEQAVFGHTSGVVGRVVPFGESIQRGVGGPVLQSGSRTIAALDKGDFKNAGAEVLKAGIMLSPIPGAMNTVIRPGEMLLKHFQGNQ